MLQKTSVLLREVEKDRKCTHRGGCWLGGLGVLSGLRGSKSFGMEVGSKLTDHGQKKKGSWE
jgi:hypothetical protein